MTRLANIEPRGLRGAIYAVLGVVGLFAAVMASGPVLLLAVIGGGALLVVSIAHQRWKQAGIALAILAGCVGLAALVMALS